MEFKERLRFLREERSISQRQLSNDLGLSNSMIHFYESGEKEPSITITQKIADYFGVSIDYLVGREKGDGLPQFIKQKLGKLENIEAKDLKSQLKDIAKKLNDIADEL